MSDHLKYDDAVVRGRTVAGATAIEVLDMNADVIVGWRHSVIRQVRRLVDEIHLLRQNLKKLDAKIRKEKSEQALERWSAVRDELHMRMAEAHADLELLAVRV
jgi:hypothetical protein